MGTTELEVQDVARAIAAADGEDYMEDCLRYDRRARFAIEAMNEQSEFARRILSETPDKWPTRSEIGSVARALLSTSSALREMREALMAIIDLDHHNHGPSSRSAEIARAAIAKAEPQTARKEAGL